MTPAGGTSQPAIPAGWATYLGTIGAGAAAATPLVQWVAGLDTGYTGHLLTLAGVLAAITQLGRYAQATWGRASAKAPAREELARSGPT